MMWAVITSIFMPSTKLNTTTSVRGSGEDAVEGGHTEVRDLHVLLGFFGDHQTAELLLIHILEPDTHENADADDDHRSNDQLVVGKPIHRGAV